MTEHVFLVVGVNPVVERFCDFWVVGKEMRNIEVLGQNFFFGVVQVFAPFLFLPILLFLFLVLLPLVFLFLIRLLLLFFFVF